MKIIISVLEDDDIDEEDDKEVIVVENERILSISSAVDAIVLLKFNNLISELLMIKRYWKIHEERKG